MPVLNNNVSHISRSSTRRPSANIPTRSQLVRHRQQLRDSFSAFPIRFPAAENHPDFEGYTSVAFISIDQLSACQRVDLKDGLAAMDAFGKAVQAEPRFHSREQQPLYRCILSALTVRDILHRSGRGEAYAMKSGLDVRQTDDRCRILTIGDPRSPKIKGMIPAHFVVRLGDILLDPSFGQLRRPWNGLPHCAAFLAGSSEGHTFNIGDGSYEARATTLHRYIDEVREIQIAYFDLPPTMDIRTRHWRSAPDARPARRESLIVSAAAIRLQQIEESGRSHDA